MHLQHGAVAGERLDVAPHGFQRNPQPVGQAGDGDGALLLQEAQDFAMPFRMDHAAFPDLLLLTDFKAIQTFLKELLMISGKTPKKSHSF